MQTARDENAARKRARPGAPGPADRSEERPSARPLRRVETPPAAAMVIAPLLGLLLWAGLFAIVF